MAVQAEEAHFDTVVDWEEPPHLLHAEGTVNGRALLDEDTHRCGRPRSGGDLIARRIVHNADAVRPGAQRSGKADESAEQLRLVHTVRGQQEERPWEKRAAAEIRELAAGSQDAVRMGSGPAFPQVNELDAHPHVSLTRVHGLELPRHRRNELFRMRREKDDRHAHASLLQAEQRMHEHSAPVHLVLQEKRKKSGVSLSFSSDTQAPAHPEDVGVAYLQELRGPLFPHGRHTASRRHQRHVGHIFKRFAEGDAEQIQELLVSLMGFPPIVRPSKHVPERGSANSWPTSSSGIAALPSKAPGMAPS
eukprot:scaffold742_cov263-Pinguiococcus_pyrenoidosus.AAC.9